MNISIQGTNIDLSQALRELVQQKIGQSLRVLGSINQESISIAIQLENTSGRYVHTKENEQLYKAVATIGLPGHTFRIEESAMDIDRAIIKLKHTMTRDLREWKKRLIESRRNGARKVKRGVAED